MVNTHELRVYMARNRMNITQVAKEMGVCSKTLSDKLSKCPGKFTYKEMESLIKILDIKEPEKVFFAWCTYVTRPLVSVQGTIN